jgi:putative heme-binding domain-containing protein
VRTGAMDRWFVGERRGKIYSLPRNQGVDTADLVIDLAAEVQATDGGKVRKVNHCYALAFHPQFATNRYCYICYILANNGDRDDGTRIARFKVTDTDPPRIDPASETVVLTFRAGGHNGCDLQFGNDGYLYISTGDATGPNPPDVLDTGQDISDLHGAILRIDVDRRDKGLAYAIPPDNPFIATPRARPEIYAYGLRNPWRMSFDRATGDLWVGDVGWELWELIYRVQKGGNYGWSVKEGRQEIRPGAKRGPTPILPPTLDFPHTEAASITGGYVYRGQRLPELRGAYVCGDWVTRKLWATRFDGDRIVWHKEIAHGGQRVVAFGEDVDGELFFLHHDEDSGSIHYLGPNEAAAAYRDTFPRKLSATGLFEAVPEHRLAAGVVPFEINAPRWADHAGAERFLAVPGTSSAKLFDNFVRVEAEFYGSYFFPPADTILGKTLALEMRRGEPSSRRRLETQILHFDGKIWRGYTYLWNEAGSDADLVDAQGRDLKLDIADAAIPGGKRRQTWHVPSRGQCLTCHNPWAGIALSFTPRQLDRDIRVDGRNINQLERFKSTGLIELKHRDWRREVPLRDDLATPLVDPHAERADLDARARSYLQANCAHCHQYNAGGTVDIDLRVELPLQRTKTLGVTPVQGTFSVPEAKILAPGDPFRSILYYRMAKLGRGRMPHLGSDVVDEAGLRLIGDWIRRMPASAEILTLLERLRELDETTARAQEASRARAEIAEDAERRAVAARRQEATPADYDEARARHAQRLARAAKDRPAERTTILQKLLGAPHHALMLMHELEQGRILPSTRPEVVSLAMSHADPQVRDLFERFAPDSLRIERLGSSIVPEKLLALSGDAERGRALFFQATFQCGSCHTIRGKGGNIGPDLSQIAARLSKPQLLENILEPSKQIDPKYLTYAAETASGQVHTGLLVQKDDREVVLRPATGSDVRLPARDIASLHAQKTSLMPDQLLRDATAQQAADLLTFLQSLK